MSERNLLERLYSSEERHAIALLDVEVEKAANGALSVPGLAKARGEVLRCMVALSERVNALLCKDKTHHVWVLLAEDLIKHPGYTNDTRQRRRRYFCERCLAKKVEIDDEPVYR